MTVCLLSLSGCSSKPQEPVTQTIYERQWIPLNLLEVGCIELAAGDTVRSLGSSWVNNTSCLRAYKKLVDGIINNYTKEGMSQYERSGERGKW